MVPTSLGSVVLFTRKQRGLDHIPDSGRILAIVMVHSFLIWEKKGLSEFVWTCTLLEYHGTSLTQAGEMKLVCIQIEASSDHVAEI